MALLEAAGTGEGVSLSPDQAGRLRAAVDRVEDQARRARRPVRAAPYPDNKGVRRPLTQF